MLQYTTGHGVGLREFGGFTMTPAVVLPPLTLVDVLGATNPKDFGQFNTTEWLKVKVEQGPFAGREGYLPATAIANCNWDLSYTAVKYGKVAKNPGQDPVVWEDVCEHCHEAPETHILPETSYGDKGGVAQQLSADTYLQPRGTNQDARRVKDTLEDLKNSFGQKDKGRFFQTGLMIGVLHVSGGKPWASHSGGGDVASFKEVVESMGFRYARGLTKRPSKNYFTFGVRPCSSILEGHASAGSKVARGRVLRP